MKASERAYKRLLEEIVAGELPPGTVLGEAEQSSRLGISRTPLREALFRLHADGLLTNPTGRGAVVTDISPDRVRKLYAVRTELEVLASRLAARNRDKDVFVELAKEFDHASKTLSLADESVSNYYSLNARFDKAIDSSTDNDYLVANLEVMRKHAARFRQVARRDLSRLVASAVETKSICEAIANHNEEKSVEATRNHVKNSLEHIMSTFTQDSPQDRITPEIIV
jgi:DNA-binding GntR family transcriptional regulator